MTLLYPDVSNNEWGLPWTAEGRQTLISFLSQLHTEGFAGVVHKVSQGSDFADPYWQTCRVWCESHDLSWLGYHYISTDDADAQTAQWTTNNGGLYAMMDFEDDSGDVDNFWAVVNAFNNAGVNVTLAYIPDWYDEEIDSPDIGDLSANQISLVSSAYPDGSGYALDIYGNSDGDNGEGWAVYAGATPTVWQFTDQASIGGISVDCNAYKGVNLNALFTGNIFVDADPATDRKL